MNNLSAIVLSLILIYPISDITILVSYCFIENLTITIEKEKFNERYFSSFDN